MSTQGGNCELIIAGERYAGFEYVAEVDEAAPIAYAFIGGPAAVLKKARLAGPIQIRFGNSSPQQVTILTLNYSGLALISFDPKLHPSAKPPK
jgi:hypothetical protein